jgi:broad specificity phosphatase PhoE
VNYYLIRAGETDAAATPDTSGEPDATRDMGLSLRGRQQTRAVASKLRTVAELEATYVISGPSPACIQTAELVAERLEFLGRVSVWRELTEGTPGAVLARRLASLVPPAWGGEPHVLVVGDEPWLSGLGAALISRPTFPPPIPSQVSAISRGQPAWRLRPEDLGKAPLLVD